MKQRSENGNAALDSSSIQVLSTGYRHVLDEPSFQRMISVERKRAERSHKSFLLVLLRTVNRGGEHNRVLGRILPALSLATRETDATGWYTNEAIVGVLFTEIVTQSRDSLVSTILTRVSTILSSQLTVEQIHQLSISFHLFPEDWTRDIQQPPNSPDLYPELLTLNESKKIDHIVKRVMDIAGSSLVLILCAPIFLVVALAIKMTSHGPVFFRQVRVGQYGIPFAMLKFRSMRENNDARNHKA